MPAQYLVKLVVTALIVVAITELSKRSTLWGAAVASLPLTSLLAFVWLYLDTGDAQRVGDLATGIFWLVLPSLTLFLLLPALLRHGFGFWGSLGGACIATALVYLAMVAVLSRFGVRA